MPPFRKFFCLSRFSVEMLSLCGGGWVVRIFFEMCMNRAFQGALGSCWARSCRNCWAKMGKWGTTCTAQLDNYDSQTSSLSVLAGKHITMFTCRDRFS